MMLPHNASTSAQGGWAERSRFPKPARSVRKTSCLAKQCFRPLHIDYHRSYDPEEEAARAFDAKAAPLGRVLNFPDEWEDFEEDEEDVEEENDDDEEDEEEDDYQSRLYQEKVPPSPSPSFRKPPLHSSF